MIDPEYDFRKMVPVELVEHAKALAVAAIRAEATQSGSILFTAKCIIRMFGCTYRCDKAKSGRRVLKVTYHGFAVTNDEVPYELENLLLELATFVRMSGYLERAYAPDGKVTFTRSDIQTVTRYYFEGEKT